MCIRDSWKPGLMLGCSDAEEENKSLVKLSTTGLNWVTVGERKYHYVLRKSSGSRLFRYPADYTIHEKLHVTSPNATYLLVLSTKIGLQQSSILIDLLLFPLHFLISLTIYILHDLLYIRQPWSSLISFTFYCSFHQQRCV